jgi:hypothetical protein
MSIQFALLFVVSLLAALAGSLGAQSASESPTVTWHESRPFNAWVAPERPSIEVELTNPAISSWEGFLRIECFDLLSEKTTVTFLPVSVGGGGRQMLLYLPGEELPYGVYRLQGTTVQSRDAQAATEKNTEKATHVFAYAPARMARDLPDDWPLGMHITWRAPYVLPGFKWYRHFSSWAVNNPARGEYDWSRLDPVVEAVKAAGGKLIVTTDSAPVWTVAPERVAGVPWIKNATAHPPDDWNDLRLYLRALLRRYGDASGVLGGLEVWNEPHTKERWLGTHEQMVEMARIFREVAHETASPPLIMGIQLSAGPHSGYVKCLINAGILQYVDLISGHWYEELGAYDSETPLSSLPGKIGIFKKPMNTAGYDLPIWNTESGVKAVPREEGCLVSQTELNKRAETSPDFDPERPWMVGKSWRMVSERRAAGVYIAGTVMLMAEGIPTFGYIHYGFVQDKAAGLPWVAFAVLGDHLHRVGHKTVEAVSAMLAQPNEANRALAFRLGEKNQPGVIVVWTYLRDTRFGRSKHWQPWQKPLAVRVPVADGITEVEVSDLYGRETSRQGVTDGFVVVFAGEEPVYIRELP